MSQYQYDEDPVIDKLNWIVKNYKFLLCFDPDNEYRKEIDKLYDNVIGEMWKFTDAPVNPENRKYIKPDVLYTNATSYIHQKVQEKKKKDREIFDNSCAKTRACGKKNCPLDCWKKNVGSKIQDWDEFVRSIKR